LVLVMDAARLAGVKSVSIATNQID
jgi:biopolymer transport protein ExbD